MRRVARGWCLWREGVVNESVGLERGVVVPICVEWREGGVCGERVWRMSQWD